MQSEAMPPGEIARGLTKLWCEWTHGGGLLHRDGQDRLNWRCSKCGRWSDNPLPVRDEILAVRAELERIADE